MAWSIAQTATYTNIVSGASVTLTSTSQGSLIVVMGNNDNTNNITSITDNVGNVYVNCGVVGTFTTAFPPRARGFYCQNAKSGITSVTINLSGGHAWGIIYEVTGLLPFSCMDVRAKVDDTASSSTPLGASVTTGETNEFIVAGICAEQNVTGINSGNEFTSDGVDGGNGWASITSKSATAAAHQPQWTLASAGLSGAITIAFREIKGGSIAWVKG